jgi:hypothetical protein
VNLLALGLPPFPKLVHSLQVRIVKPHRSRDLLSLRPALELDTNLATFPFKNPITINICFGKFGDGF